jgi:DNA-binding NarL/FixJ family response regulator
VLLLESEPIFASGVATVLAGAGLRVQVTSLGEDRPRSGGRPFVERRKSEPRQVLILDSGLAEAGLPALVTSARQAHPPAAIVLILRREAQEGLLALIDAGVSALLHRRCEPEEMLAAVRAAGQSMTWVSPPLANSLRQQAAADRMSSAGPTLSERELQVLHKLGVGSSNAQIASDLSISENTVRNHVAAILVKLGARNRTDAVTRAARRGLVEISG